VPNVALCGTRKTDWWLRNGTCLKVGKISGRFVEADEVTFSVVWSNRSVGTSKMPLSKHAEEVVANVTV
jgi:hypothetical protein